jgi:hypothetical protein
VVIPFSDQNISPTLSAENGQCINIARVKKELLLELTVNVKKIFETVKFPMGGSLCLAQHTTWRDADYLSTLWTGIKQLN